MVLKGSSEELVQRTIRDIFELGVVVAWDLIDMQSQDEINQVQISRFESLRINFVRSDHISIFRNRENQT